MKHDLILACSATKSRDPLPLPALERYDGPAYRTFRRNRRRSARPPLILSAEFGLIEGDRPIPFYDRKMNDSRACVLAGDVGDRLIRLDRAGELAPAVLFVGGKAYRECLIRALGGTGILERIQFASGGIGDQLGQLKAWLRRAAR